MVKPQEQAKFWRLLTDYEALTRQETVAVWHRDYSSLEEAQRLKAVIFPVWTRLGMEMHLNRQNCPELRQRLDAISATESANLEAIAAQREDARRRVGELAASRQRLHQVGKNYQPGSGSAPGSFAAVG